MQSNVDAPWDINVGFTPSVIAYQYRIIYGYYDVNNNYGYYDVWGHGTITKFGHGYQNWGIAANGYMNQSPESSFNLFSTNGPDGNTWIGIGNRDKLMDFNAISTIGPGTYGSSTYLTSSGFHMNFGYNFRSPGPGNWAGVNWAAYE
ncbi:hypothetical protein D3C75_764370 [compost metagenome]